MDEKAARKLTDALRDNTKALEKSTKALEESNRITKLLAGKAGMGTPQATQSDQTLDALTAHLQSLGRE